MEIHKKSQGREENSSFLNSPSSTNNIAKNDAAIHLHSPRTTITRSETNPYPTTFVQADTSNFKQVVQMLTGSETAQHARKYSTKNNNQNQSISSRNTCHNHHHVIPPIKTTPKKQQGFRLYERRNQLKNTPMINTFMPKYSVPENLSPSMLDFPKLGLNSPVTPLSNSPLLGGSSSSEEEKAIAEKGFYLHPSPRSVTPRDSKPQLLPLFPVESPKLS